MIQRRIWSIPKSELSRDIRNMVIAYLMPLWYYGVSFYVHSQATYGLMLALATTLAVWLGGSVFYAKHYPEKLYPGIFDLVGSSHNLMHVLAFVAHGLEFKFLEHAITTTW